MGPGHDRWGDAAGSYLLGALPESEREAYEAHLSGCAECREEIDELAPAAHALPVSVHPIAPPAALKGRIMAEVEREAALLAAAGPEADRVPARAGTRRRRWLPAMPRLAVVTAAATLLVVGAVAGYAVTRLGGDDARTVVASGTSDASLELDGDQGTLRVRGLAAPASGRVYQVWLKRDGHAPEPTSVLFLPSRNGVATASVPGPLDGIDQVMVTPEPKGGSPQPTSKPVLVAELS